MKNIYVHQMKVRLNSTFDIVLLIFSFFFNSSWLFSPPTNYGTLENIILEIYLDQIMVIEMISFLLCSNAANW